MKNKIIKLVIVLLGLTIFTGIGYFYGNKKSQPEVAKACAPYGSRICKISNVS